MNQSYSYDLVIVGAGIHGASLAYYCAQAGQRVILIEESRPASGASGHAFGWINASALTEPVQHLAQRVIDDYNRLHTELPSFPLRWCGELTYGACQEKQDLCEAGLNLSPLQPLTIAQDEIRALEPNLAHPPIRARYMGAAGVTSPVEAIECLIQAAKGFGANVISNCAANELLVENGLVVGVSTQAGNIHGSKTVLTAGLGTLDLLSRQGMHLPIRSSPAIIIKFDVSNDLLNGIVSSSEMEARQAGARTLIAAENYIDDTQENGPVAIGLRALKAIRAELNGAESIELRSVAVGWRPIPDDRLPIVGPMSQYGGLYIMSAHPGLTLAPTLARLFSQELITNIATPLLSDFRPSRFQV
ncbi:NAD(P)/FAD-dependent oxidoreductase [Pseudomonas sp. KB_15]|uniref:NAD(P)/FAD-dependent oxidoreductase n=1 Tax=Pseudomonas sp. KB_15 TaxID=3233035 RepID=UPI003F992AA5